MNNEFQQMMFEIDRIAGNTTFNSINMLNSAGTVASGGNTGNVARIHFGENSFIDVGGVNVQTTALIDSASTITIAGADGTDAQTALGWVTSAIERKDSARASLGYMMNRLESTNEVLNIQAENMMTAESRISDVDVATEVAVMTRNQVLAQAGVSMLSQANTMPQMALNLLR
jgi:flagellin